MDRIAWSKLNSMTPYAVNASLTEARGVIVLWFQRKVQGVVASNHSLSIIVVPPFGPELKFEPELFRTEPDVWSSVQWMVVT